MAYKFNGNKKFFDDFNKLTDDCRDIALGHGIKITANPYIGEKRTGSWRDFWKVEFFHKTSYRIIYTIYHCKKSNSEGKFFCLNEITHYHDELDTCEGLVDYVFIKTRQAMDNIYRLQKNKVDGYKRYLG